jgi:hypothetical protein
MNNNLKTAKAAVFTGVNKPFEIKEYELTEPSEGMAKIKLVASGICGTDIHPCGFTIQYPGHNMNLVLLGSRCCYAALARFPSVELFLDVGLRDFQTRRAAVHNDPHAATMGLAKGRDPK